MQLRFNLSDSKYGSLYIRDRLTASRVTSGTRTFTLLTNTHENSGGVTITDPGGLREHDSTYGTSFLYRGNVISRTDLTGTTTFTYDVGGNAMSAALPGGLTVSGSYQSATNFATPSSSTIAACCSECWP